MKSLALLLSLVLPLGCAIAPPPQPIVSDISHDRVLIQYPTGVYQHDLTGTQKLQREAERACGVYGRIATNTVSTKCLEWSGELKLVCLRKEALFACAPADGAD